MLNWIVRKAASVARNRWADYTRRDRLFTDGKRLLWTGPLIDRLLDYLHAWKNLQYRPRIRSPRTLNEFILASKYDFQGDMALARRIVDKVRFKVWLGETPAWRPLIVPTLEVFDTPQALRGRVFDADTVLKPTQTSGDVILIDRRRRLTDEELEKAGQWQKRDYYRLSREPVYKGLAPRIICEPLLRDRDGLPVRDFKLFMIGGQPLMIQLDGDRYTRHTRQLYSPGWRLLEYEFQYPRPADPFPRPAQLDAALRTASDLARPFPICRIDLYLLSDGVIKAGEVTFFPEGGKGRFRPIEGDFEFGRKVRALISGTPDAETGR